MTQLDLMHETFHDALIATVMALGGYKRIVSDRDGSVCEPVSQPDGHPDLWFRNRGFTGPDARLLVEAPNALPALLAERDSVRAALTNYVREFADYHYHTCPAGALPEAGGCDCYAGTLAVAARAALGGGEHDA